jgi:hypothetical protein
MAASLLGIAALILLPCAITTGLSLDGGLSDLHNLVRTMGDRLASLSSESEAEDFFINTLSPMLNLPSIAENTRQATSPPETARQAGGRLSAELAAWHLAKDLREADFRNSDVLAGLQSRLDRQHWLVDRRPLLRRVGLLLAVLSPFASSAEHSDVSDNAFESYARYLDRTYPDFAGGERSWIYLAEQHGYEGFRRRLQEFWQEQPPDVRQEASAARYFETRLRPVLTAHLAAAAVRAEAQSEYQAREYYRGLWDRSDDIRQQKGLARLCGTWQWTVHNHQNHQDHKMMISFPSIEAWESRTANGLRPARAIVHGDSVYLRWEFQGGVQEDSLLFGREGQRLEGSFVNSAGAWGSITGKRVSPCEEQEKRQKRESKQ